MFKDAPFISGQIHHFNDAEKALAYVHEIYDANIAYLQDSFEKFTKGETPEKKIEAFYPYVAIEIKRFEMKDTRLSYGFIAEPGRYSTTLTRPDIFQDYFLEQFQQLLSNHQVPLEIGVSQTPIPVHFAFQKGKSIEGNLSPDKTSLLRELFSLPDLSKVDDSIANGDYVPVEGEDKPLALFSAPRTDYSLERLRHYTGTKPADFQKFVIFTNYLFYVDEFIRQSRELLSCSPKGEAKAFCYNSLIESASTKNTTGKFTLPQMPAYHLTAPEHRGVTIINIGVGPSNARTITDHVAVLRPDAWIMLGHCAGLRESQRLGDYVLAHAYVRDDHILDHELPVWVPIPALSEIQLAMEGAVASVTGRVGYGLKSVMRTGTVVSTDNRNWELSGFPHLVKKFNHARAIALDMESAAIAANGYRLRVPYGTLLCVSDRPLHGEVKLPGMASEFYRKQVEQHLSIGLKVMDRLRENGDETLHSRKLRSYAEVAFR